MVQITKSVPTAPNKGQPIKHRAPSLVAEAITQPPKTKWWQKPKRIEHVIQSLTLLFVGAYTVISLCLFLNTRELGRVQLEKADKTNSISRENFTAEQRPYIWLTDNLGTPQLLRAPNGALQIIWEWHFTNYGKTPAHHTHNDQFISINGGSFEFSNEAANHPPKIGIPIPPNLTPRLTIVSRPITDEIWAKAVSTDLGISISGTIDYEDAAGNKYQSTFCIGRLATGAILYREPAENCHNEIR